MAKIWQDFIMSTSNIFNEFKKKLKIIKKFLLRAFIGVAILIAILLLVCLSYFEIYRQKVYPNLSVANINISGLTINEAANLISSKVSPNSEFTLSYQEQTIILKPTDIDLTYNFTESVQNAYKYTRTGAIIPDIVNRIKLLIYPQNFPLVITVDSEKLSKITSVVSGQISIDPINPKVSKADIGVIVDKGSLGREVNQKSLKDEILRSIAFNLETQISIPVDIIDNSLNDTEAAIFSTTAQKFLNKTIVMKFEYNNIVLKDVDILKLLNPKGGYDDNSIVDLSKNVAASIEREPQNPKFVFDNGKVTEFQPSLDGIKLDTLTFKNQIIEMLDKISVSDNKELSFDIPVAKIPPKITTDKVNNLGIKELIGRGTSTYFHSIKSRVHNIVLAASRINGILVAPGDTFSFNNALGDVSAFTGYQQAYIISGGKTILGDGGGVCQVSTTLFRAVLNAGLPIQERQAHAYRVGYYEQDSPPGIDATVYSPSPDLKFTNDTNNYILIEASADPINYSLIFEIYGTSDGRISSISKPVVTNVTAPPPDLYQDDPSLPIGTIKQIDFKAWGAKVTFNYSVKRDGQEIYAKTFISNYKPWQAVYLRGTGPSN